MPDCLVFSPVWRACSASYKSKRDLYAIHQIVLRCRALCSGRDTIRNRCQQSGHQQTHALLGHGISVAFTGGLYGYSLRLYRQDPLVAHIAARSGRSGWFPVMRRGGTAAFILIAAGADVQNYRTLCTGVLLVALALLALMGVALYQRVEAYGLTDKRYMVCLFLIWMTLATLAALRLRRTAVVRDVLLDQRRVVCPVPPLGVTQMTVASQYHRLMLVLQEQHMIVDGRVKAPEVPMPTDKASQDSKRRESDPEQGARRFADPLIPV